MMVEYDLYRATFEDIAPAVSLEPITPIVNGTNISEAIVNPDLLRVSSENSTDANLVNGKPPGYLSEGDWIVLERHSKAYKEPPMGIHDVYACPNCKH